MELVFSLQGVTGINYLNLTGIPNITTRDIQRVVDNTRIFNMAVGLTMLLFGVPGALFCCYITYKNASRKSSLTALLITNSASSMLFLCLAVPWIIIRPYTNKHIPSIVCSLYAWLQATVNCVNLYSLIMLLTVRFLAMAFPHTFFNRIIGKRGVTVIITMFISSSVYCMRFFFSQWDSRCTLVMVNILIPWVYVVVEFILPVILIVIFSVLMMTLIKQSRGKRISQGLVNQGILFMQIAQLNCGWIFVSTLPCFIHFIIPVSYVYDLSSRLDGWVKVRMCIMEMLVLDAFYFRLAADSIVYFACSKRFRGELAELLRLKSLISIKMPLAVNLSVAPGETFHLEESSHSIRLAPGISRSMIAFPQPNNSETDVDGDDICSVSE